MKVLALDQDSPEWLAWRDTGLGSSDAAAVLGLSPWKTRRALWEEKLVRYRQQLARLGHPDPDPALTAKVLAARKADEGKNESAKRRGKDLEPVARAEYEWLMDVQTPPACGVHPGFEFLKVSLDGYAPERSLFVEIKAPNQRAHDEALYGTVPHYYIPQVYHQFVVSGLELCHYVSYHPKYPAGKKLAVVPVRRRDVADQVGQLQHVEVEFWESVVAGEYFEPGK